ncbi:Sieve element occlusion, N-terminal [Trema orientale]|uniref:Sieve element occlusion, N-terminal n=1 Tax=Trema orientale TaxID=63057 RepID=A0A2P5DXR8_TREOI|nr:Sieve element occlusion, N-terminal [Trema orientale]
MYACKGPFSRGIYAYGIRVHVDHIAEKTPRGSFSAPLCTLKQICSEMSCKASGEEIAHETTLSILEKVRSYTWEAKAVLTLAAFALEYGDFWLLAELHHSHDHDQLTKSLEILKKVPAVIRPLELQKRRQAILELNDLIKATLQVIEYIYEFEKLSSYDPKDVPALSVAMEHFPVDVYWVIRTIVACTTKMNLLHHDDEYQQQDLSPYSQKIQYIINKYKIQLILCKKQIEEADAYRKLRKLMKTPTEIMEIFKALIFSRDNVLPQHRFLIFTRDINVQPLIDGSANKTV